MANYEDALDSILNGDINFSDVSGDFKKYTTMTDEHEPIVIKGKDVNVIPNAIGTIMQGDTNSQMLTFLVDRYYEGIDLSAMDIGILYILPDSKKTLCLDKASNVQTSDDGTAIKFTWVIKDAASAYTGTLSCSITFIGKNELNEDYCFNTKSFNIPVNSTVHGTAGTTPLTEDWYKADLSEYAKTTDLTTYAKTSDIVDFVTASDVETLVNEKVEDAIINSGISGGGTGTGNIGTATNEEITTMFTTLKAKYF